MPCKVVLCWCGRRQSTGCTRGAGTACQPRPPHAPPSLPVLWRSTPSSGAHRAAEQRRRVPLPRAGRAVPHHGRNHARHHHQRGGAAGRGGGAARGPALRAAGAAAPEVGPGPWGSNCAVVAVAHLPPVQPPSAHMPATHRPCRRPLLFRLPCPAFSLPHHASTTPPHPRRCLARSEELQLPHLVAFSRLALARFQMLHPQDAAPLDGRAGASTGASLFLEWAGGCLL